MWVVVLGAFLAVPQTEAPEFVFPSGIVIDRDGHIYVADRGAHRVFRIEAGTNRVTTVIGTGVEGFSGDGGAADLALVRNPEWLAFDSHGNLVLADRGNHRVRRVDARSGIITTIAGNGELAHSGDGGPAVNAGITNPFGLLLDGRDNLYIFDTEAHSIRRVDPNTGVIATVIGSARRGFAGDGGPASEAMLYRPHNGIWWPDGTLIFGDSFNQRIRQWDPRNGVITTIAGSGERGVSPDGTPFAQAKFTYFGAMAIDRDGGLLFTSLDHRILKLDFRRGVVRVIAGTGEAGFGGDGGPALAAQLNTPYGLAMAPNGDIVFADADNRRIRRIDAGSGIIQTIAGGR